MIKTILAIIWTFIIAFAAFKAGDSFGPTVHKLKDSRDDAEARLDNAKYNLRIYKILYGVCSKKDK